MRTKNSIMNSIASLISSLFNAILGIISQALFLKILNVEFLGINGLFTNIIAMLSIAELGVGNAIIVNLYKPLHENNIEKIKSLMHFYRKAYNIIAIVIMLLGIMLIPFLKYFVGEVTVQINITIVYLLFLISTASSYLLTYKRSILYADQKNYIIKIIEIIYLFVYNIAQIVVLYLTKNYYLYLVTRIICQVIENICISITANKKYKYLKDKNYKKLDKKTEKNIFGKVKALSIHKIASFIVNGTDDLIISSFLGIVPVGLYSNYYKIIINVKRVFTQIISSSSASVGNLLVEENKEKSFLIFKKIRFLNFWFTAFSSVCLLTAMQDFIVLWVGEEYLLSDFVLWVLIVNQYQKLMRYSYSVFKDSAGIWQEDKYIPILESILNIVFSILLLKVFGLAGVFMGTIISGLVLWCYSYPKFVYKKLFNRRYLDYTKETLGYIFMFIFISIIAYGLCSLITIPNIIIKFILKIIISTIVANTLIVIKYHKTKEFKYFIQLIKNILGIKKILNNKRI